MKKLFMTIAPILIATLLLAACSGNGNGSGSGNALREIANIRAASGEAGEAALGRPFEVEGLEITLFPNIGFTRFRDTFSDKDGAYVFYVPITVTNIGDTSNGLNMWRGVNIFSPDGIGMMGDVTQFDLEHAYSETSIFGVGNVQPGVTKEGNLYVFYSEDGEYIIEFYDVHDNTAATVKIMLEFDFDAVPEIITEFELGETIDIDGLEITITEIVSWGTIRNTWSAHSGEHYFVLSATMRNNTNASQRFPWGFNAFAPNGHSLPNIAWEIDDADMTMADEILPGASLSGLLHLLYVGDGDYTLQFSDWSMLDDLTMRVPIKFDSDVLPVFQTVFTLGETFVFDGLEITIIDDMRWGTIEARWSDLNGRNAMAFPIIVTNVGDSTNNLGLGSVTVFGPDGLQLDDLTFYLDDSLLLSGDIRPGATLESIFPILYDGDGVYVIEFYDWHGEPISVIFNVAIEE